MQERLRNKSITLDVDQKTRDCLAKIRYLDVYGARAVARVVKQKVVFSLTQKILEGTIRCACGFSTLQCYADGDAPVSRDGGTVVICVSESRENLEIHDNHPPDAAIGSAVSP